MKKQMGLTTKIFLGLVLGAILGMILYYFVPEGSTRTIVVDGFLYVIGNAFLKILQMLVVPLVFCSLVCGSLAMGDTKKLGKIGVKTLLFYLCTTALAITIALLVASLINPGIGLDLSSIEKGNPTIAESKGFADVLLSMIPTNPVGSLASGSMLQIIVFSLILGVVIANLSDKTKTVANFFKEFNEIMMFMTVGVMKIAPIGVFCLIARTFSNIGWTAFAPMLKYMVAVFLALFVQCFIVYMIMLKAFSNLNPIKFIKKFFPVMSFAFSTATSNATIPMSIETLTNKIGVSKKISSFTIPLGATINMDGTAIMQGVAVIFVAQAYNIDLSFSSYLTVIFTATLASIGTAGVPGVGLITLSMVFNAVGLPVEGIALIMGIDRILDMTRTMVNITGDAVCTTIVAKQENEFNSSIFNDEIKDNAKLEMVK